MSRPAMLHDRPPADIPPRMAKLMWIIAGIATTALGGTVTVAVHCFSHVP